MSDTIDIIWAEQYRTSQVYSNGAEVALSNSKGKQIGPMVFCKDFLHDALRAAIHGKPSSIYSYQTGADEMADIEVNQPYVLLTNSQASDLQSKLPNVLDFMRQADAELVARWPVPTSYKIANNPPKKYAECGVSYWTASPLWMIAPPAFSLWTLMLRNGAVHTIGQPWMDTIQAIIKGDLKPGVQQDHTYFEYSIPGIELMRKYGLDGVFSKTLVPEEGREKWFADNISANYPAKLETSTLHHFGGIVSFSDKSGKSAFPNLKWKWPTATKKAPSICHA